MRLRNGRGHEREPLGLVLIGKHEDDVLVFPRTFPHSELDTVVGSATEGLQQEHIAQVKAAEKGLITKRDEAVVDAECRLSPLVRAVAQVNVKVLVTPLERLRKARVLHPAHCSHLDGLHRVHDATNATNAAAGTSIDGRAA